MPRDFACAAASTATAGGPAAHLAPVAAPSTIWSLARREFAIKPVAQLPSRGTLLDVLERLDRGHFLALMGSTVPAVWLDGHPDIGLLAGVLFFYGYVEIVGRHRENEHVVYFGLSEAGQRKLREGRDWWNALSWRERLRVRLFG